MNRNAVALLIAASTALATPVLAQTGRGQGAAPPPILQTQDAQQTREELRELLRQHPDSLREVLRADPSLANPEYLSPYPLLLNFIQQHPEIVRNQAYFFGSLDFRQQQPRDRSFEMFQMVIAGFGVILAVGSAIGVFTWLIRFFVDHRRWLRMTRTQTDVHTKLLDRLSNNEDLMAYMQSAAGRRFLESTPIALDDQPKAIAAPMSRILWSMQAGVVLASLGIGFFLAQSRFPEDMGEGFYIIGMLVAALGVGFGLSAVLAYMISQRFGLVAPPPPASTHD
jgi:hypothetical protein